MSSEIITIPIHIFEEVLVTLKHARMFICTKQQMNFVGVNLHNELIDTLEAIKKQEE